MFANLLRTLNGPEPRPLADLDLRRALAGLMVRIARSDGQYAPEEVARIDRVLARRFALAPDAAEALRREGEDLEREAPGTHRFTQAIKDGVPYDDRIGVIEALWSVALADGERDPEEDSLLRMLAHLLGVTDQESALARQRAQSAG
ncbi:MAG: tellurite resistance TerB family protein [Hasllibacter sp.]